METAVDDLNLEILPYLEERLSTVPVLDYQVTPVVMKKGRVGSNVLVLVEPVLADKAMEVIFKETTTLGVRRSRLNGLVYHGKVWKWRFGEKRFR